MPAGQPVGAPPPGRRPAPGRQLAALGDPVRASARNGPLARPRAPSRRFLPVWLAATAVLLLLGLTWSFATPLGGSPDEASQAIRAAAVVRGEWIGRPVPGQPPAVTQVTVPAGIADLAVLPLCYMGKPQVPAGCAPQDPISRRPTQALTYMGHYPPLYYLLVGLPSLISAGPGAVYGMRVLSALWAALLLGLALAIAARWSTNPLLLPALLVAVTPMTLFLAGVVNASGLEIAAATAAWTGTVVLVSEHAEHPPRGLVAATAISTMALVLVRGLSPLWAALIALAAAAVFPAGVRRLLRRPAIRRWLIALGAVGGLAVAWIVAVGGLRVLPDGQPVPRHASDARILLLALGRMGLYLREAVGVFGWLDTPSPLLVYLAFGLLAAVVVLGALLLGRTPGLLALGGFLLVCVLLPAGIIASQARVDGLVWQGRDGLPLWVGLPLLAAGTLVRPNGGPPRLANTRLPIVVVTLASGAQFAAWFWALRRNVVGLGGSLDVLARPADHWTPPVSVPSLLLLAVLAAVLYAVLALGCWPNRRPRAAGAAAPGSPPLGLALPADPPGVRPAGRQMSVFEQDLRQVFDGPGTRPGTAPLSWRRAADDPAVRRRARPDRPPPLGPTG